VNIFVKLTALVVLAAQVAAPQRVQAAGAETQFAAGQAIAFDRSAGNCLSCHMIPGGELPGNVGPPLIQVKLRFPDRAVLRAQIWDAAVRNPNTVMPPYGRHSILTEDEIDHVVDFIHSI
jgi:sulfur-oxidizing protein SoxX